MMNLDCYKEKVVRTVAEPMLSFIEDCENSDYTAGDVETCKKLLETYLDALAAMDDPADNEIMEQVKILVLALNELNEQTDYALIETGEREAIWEIIQNSAVACGLKNPTEDITEEWREW